ncbi:hypothetical protein GCK72_000514 [Caenorhabditis remanei]|uniref:Uncharacterized protein n=1 Tax=Caenorhabditis remanei TaxID=31234 RepID=A0A6A5HNC2_CAERE|nr:hypothetical protein GCK72_000514 [Caenorhabditis remanei]KAF1768701.1 hypothetical protein GCK72_000514 [Caenorhabditis remanei]
MRFYNSFFTGFLSSTITSKYTIPRRDEMSCSMLRAYARHSTMTSLLRGMESNLTMAIGSPVDSARWHVNDFSNVLLIDVGGSTAVDGDRSWLVAFLDLFWDRVGWEIGWTPSDETIQRDDDTCQKTHWILLKIIIAIPASTFPSLRRIRIVLAEISLDLFNVCFVDIQFVFTAPFGKGAMARSPPEVIGPDVEAVTRGDIGGVGRAFRLLK